jgi:hypothetical protein
LQPTGLVRADCRRLWSPMTSLYRISHSLLFRIRTRHSVASHNRLNRIHPSCSHASLTRGAHLLPSHSPSSTHHAHSCWSCCPSRLALLAFRSHENSLPRFSAITLPVKSRLLRHVADAVRPCGHTSVCVDLGARSVYSASSQRRLSYSSLAVGVAAQSRCSLAQDWSAPLHSPTPVHHSPLHLITRSSLSQRYLALLSSVPLSTFVSTCTCRRPGGANSCQLCSSLHRTLHLHALY